MTAARSPPLGTYEQGLELSRSHLHRVMDERPPFDSVVTPPPRAARTNVAISLYRIAKVALIDRMLLRVDVIREVGRFAQLRQKAPQFGRLTLIFARNGYGKSTLCAIVRSAAEADPKLIAARRRLGATAESKVEMEWQSQGAVTFSGKLWSACPGNVHVFDAEYVRLNLHVAESVTRDNKRSLLTVILGRDGVTLRERVSQLDAEQKEVGIAQATAERVIRSALPIVSDIEKFVEADVPANIDVLIESAEKAVGLAQHAMAVRDKALPVLVSIRGLTELELIAATELSDVSDRAAEQTQAHLASHKMHPAGERWLKYGLDHMTGSSCPFCAQDTKGLDLVSAFKTYFNVALTDLTAKIDAVLEDLQFTLGSDELKIAEQFRSHTVDWAFWNAVCDLGETPTLTESRQTEIAVAVKSLIALFERKMKKPHVAQRLSAEEGAQIAAALGILHTYNVAAQQCITAIQTARSATIGQDVRSAQDKLARLRAWKAKLIAPIKDEVDRWRIAARRRAEIEAEKGRAQTELKKYVDTNVKSKQETINDLLELFGANFRIKNTKASFIGRTPNTEFGIAIGPHVIPSGERSADAPSFHTVLSGGDKFTLALCFFLMQVRCDPNLASSVILFDDPFSSQDMQRQWETTSQLRALANDASQVVVLSHDPRFLALIEKNARSSTSFQLTCTDRGEGAITQWSSADELKELYVRQAERIREYASSGTFLKEVSAESLVKDLRPFTEDYIRARFPGRFAPLVMLNDMVEEIETAGSPDPLFNDVAHLRAINEYTRDAMHAGASAPDPGQLRAQCQRLVKLVGSY